MEDREGAQKTVEGENCEMPLGSAGCGTEKGEDGFATGLHGGAPIHCRSAI
jgi:hypothetical protein